MDRIYTGVGDENSHMRVEWLLPPMPKSSALQLDWAELVNGICK